MMKGNQERDIQMTEQQEETIREEYFLLHRRNTHSKHILRRIKERYLKCLRAEKKKKFTYKGGHLG